jgi:ElaB/YqjD/DUF883 family membrane-anchored ribosome-binding protein
MHSLQAIDEQLLAKPDISDISMVERDLKQRVSSLETELAERSRVSLAQSEAVSQRVNADLAKMHKSMDAAKTDISGALAGEMQDLLRLYKEELQDLVGHSERELKHQAQRVRQHLDSALGRVTSDLDNSRSILQHEVRASTHRISRRTTHHIELHPFEYPRHALVGNMTRRLSATRIRVQRSPVCHNHRWRVVASMSLTSCCLLSDLT